MTGALAKLPRPGGRRGVPGARGHPAVEDADGEDERADPGADAQLERERDGVEERAPDADRHEDRDREALEEDHAHRGLPRETRALDELEGDDRVDAESGRGR